MELEMWSWIWEMCLKCAGKCGVGTGKCVHKSHRTLELGNVELECGVETGECGVRTGECVYKSHRALELGGPQF